VKAIHQNSTRSLNEERASGSSEGFRFAIWKLLCEKAMTDRELMLELGTSDPNNIRPEVTRLKQDGLVLECGKRICAVTKKQVRISAATGLPYKSRATIKSERLTS
jgi:hypothetical protein